MRLFYTAPHTHHQFSHKPHHFEAPTFVYKRMYVYCVASFSWPAGSEIRFFDNSIHFLPCYHYLHLSLLLILLRKRVLAITLLLTSSSITFSPSSFLSLSLLLFMFHNPTFTNTITPFLHESEILFFYINILKWFENIKI